MRLRAATLKGDFIEVDALHAAWMARRSSTTTADAARLYKRVDRADDANDTEWDSEDTSNADEDMDVDAQTMGSARPKPDKPGPEIDDDGFTKVVGKKKR